MNEILITVIIGLASLPLAAIILRAIFGKSIMFALSLWTVYFATFSDVLFFIVGKLGIFHMIWAVPAAFGVGALVYIYINKSLRKPLESSILQIKSLSEGLLDIHIHENKSENELGILNQSIKNLHGSLTKIISEIRKNANYLAEASQSLSTASEQLAQGANEQASSVEEVSSTMEEIASNTLTSADNAEQTEKIASVIADSVRKVSEAANESLKSVHDIAGKINIITEIAFQTNILALNAAVEAARAGETGKGFGVVASEVRKLAERSKIAADEIVSLAEKSVKVTEESGRLMFGLIPEIEKTTQLVHEISVASVEQKSGTNQVNDSLQQLNNVTQQNAESSEQIAIRSEKLTDQASKLINLISYFRIEKK